MKYYSVITKRLYDTEEELLKDEKKVEAAALAEKRKKEEYAENRKNRAKEVESLLKEAITAQKKYKESLASFNKDFGPFHFTWDNGKTSIWDLFDWF